MCWCKRAVNSSMGIVRLIYGMKSESINIEKSLIVSAFFCIIGYFVTVFSPYAFLSLIGCGISGLSVAIMWPSVFSLAAKNYNMGGTAMFALLALAGDVGCSIGPGIVGLVSNNRNISDRFSFMLINSDYIQAGLKIGILFAVIFPVIMFIVLILFKNRKNKSV